MIKNLEWEDAWIALTYATVAVLVITAVFATLQDKKIDMYYIESADRGTCVWAHWTWHTDGKVFCSDDPFKTIDVARKANELIGRK